MTRRILFGCLAIGLSFSVGCGFFAKPKKAAAPPAPVQTTVETEDLPPEDDLTNTDQNLDADLRSAVDIERIDDANVEAKVTDPNESIGVSNEIPGASHPAAPETASGFDGSFGGLEGAGAMGSGMMNPGFSGRSGSTRLVQIQRTGGTAESEAVVARGLAWLAKQQKPDGTWEFEGGFKADKPAATGMALLPFLAAGYGHQPSGNNTYAKTVSAGIKALLKMQLPDGSFQGSGEQVSHAIATLALVDAFGMTQDRSLLQVASQKAFLRIQRFQAEDGSWGYSPLSPGDTAITGWQIQALAVAKLNRSLVVDPRVLAKANKFLDSVASGKDKEKFSAKAEPNSPSLNMTASGLLSRCLSAGWNAESPGFKEGVKYLIGNALPQKGNWDSNQICNANQVVFRHGGDAWLKEWNPTVRDFLINSQLTGADEKQAGSWASDNGLIGVNYGRLGTTALALLSLEVYYRYPLVWKPEAEKPKLTPR